MNFQYKGHSFSINAASEDDHIYKYIVESQGFYEADLLEYINSLKSFFPRKKSIAIDVGANIGNHSIFLGTFLSDYIFSIEPYKPVFQILKKNLEINLQNDKYRVFCLAIGATAGSGLMQLPDEGTNNVGMMRFEASSEGGEIRLMTLDHLIGESLTEELSDAIVTILKIDVEGMEMSVLEGAERTLERFKPHLFVELSTDTAFEAASHFLSKFRYKVISCHADTPVYHFAYRPSFLLHSFVKYLDAKLYFDKKLKPKILRKLRAIFD